MSMLSDFQSDPISISAKAKMGTLNDENFCIYKFEWRGDIKDRANCVLEVTGAQFREAKSGPRKGQKCIMIKNTDKVCFLTPDEIDNLYKDNTQ